MAQKILGIAAGMAGQRVDRTALKVNQSFIVGLLALGFLLSQPWLAALVAAVMIVGTAAPGAALFQQIYHRLLKPAGLLKADVQAEDPTPHRFAQGLGGAVLSLGVLALFAGMPALGWGLTIVVIALAAINLAFGF
ncbi:DUF4395 domain-containing protein, partial [Oscillochloris sp. ZM17-4]|uniref:DUF4395 domain-containing protein n=1 Tax=Oscillochloris sp. ZM17-4 TaxID=2866714 RepID=UPI0021030635